MTTPVQNMSKERGVTLIVTLIMLVIMMLLAIAAINISTTNLKVVGNMQLQQEATNAAQSAINQVLSKGTYLSDPTTAPTSLTVGDYTVSLAPPCLKSAVTLFESDFVKPLNAEDQKCIPSSQWTWMNGVAMSDCARVTFQIAATINDPSTKVQVRIVEGASMRMDRVIADAYKNDAGKRCS